MRDHPSAAPAPADGATRPARLRDRLGRTFWIAVALVLAAAGTVVSLVAASSIARNDAHLAEEEFESTAAEIASTLELAIQREEDLGVSGQAFLTANPDATNTEFIEWADANQAFDRNLALEGLGFARFVPESELDAYIESARADPAGPLGPDGTFEISPPGDRPFYCFIVSSPSRTGESQPAGIDFCATPIGPALLEARDSARPAILALDLGDQEPVLVIQRPVYRGAPPEAVEERREELLGWVGTAGNPQVLLASALGDRREIGLELRYDGVTDAVFQAGARGGGADSVTIPLADGLLLETEGLSLEVFGDVEGAAIWANASARALLLTGIAVSLLLGLLVVLLATGRSRALQLVREKTGQLRHHAFHDDLTGLPNRALLVDRLALLVARHRRHGDDGAVLFVDLDGFKTVNDTLGHDAGDRLLRAVARRLRAGLRDVDTIGRIGGDEFVALIDGGEPGTTPEPVAERLLEAMREPFEISPSPTPITVTASIGIARIDDQSPEDLLRDADIALYRAKTSGRDCYERFRPEMGSRIRHRFELESDLRGALEGHELTLEYQPVYELEDLEIVGAEALLRWQHPTLGAVAPESFLPLLESSGIAADVGQWMLNEACTRAASWRARDHGLVVSVNALPRQFERRLVVDQVRAALTLSGLEPRALCIEVTETVLMHDPEATSRLLGELKDLGVLVAIDDFGSGYSSLARLQHLPFDALKIDRTFIDAIDDSPVAAALVQTMVHLGQDLGFRTMAQGLDAAHQLDHLRSHGVDHAQGAVLGDPVDAETFAAQLPEVAPSPNRS